MLSIFDGTQSLNRRQLLQIGGLGMGGLSLSSLLNTKALANQSNGRPNPLTGKSVIFFFSRVARANWRPLIPSLMHPRAFAPWAR